MLRSKPIAPEIPNPDFNVTIAGRSSQDGRTLRLIFLHMRRKSRRLLADSQAATKPSDEQMSVPDIDELNMGQIQCSIFVTAADKDLKGGMRFGNICGLPKLK